MAVASAMVLALSAAAPAVAQPAGEPVIWFGPLPPTEHRSGVTDYMDLFASGAEWPVTTAHTRVFSLFGGWVAHDATDEELRIVVDGVRRRGFKLAVEAGPLFRPADCGEGYDGMAGPVEGDVIARRIRKAGGTIDYFAYDEPFYNANVRTDGDACLMPPEEVGRRIYPYFSLMRRYFPDIQLGGNEPLIVPVDSDLLARWLDAYEEAVGEPMAFLHLDVDWGRPDWPEAARDVAEMVRARDMPFGIFYLADAPRRDWWVDLTGEHIKTFEAIAGPPDEAVFEAWTLQPDRALPESDDDSFTGLVRRYVTDFDGLGFRTTGPGANLAFGRRVVASSVQPGQPPSNAVDGEPALWWSAGGLPPAWIEVKLDEPSEVAEIRLTVSQWPPNFTRHIVYVKGADGRLRRIAELRGTTYEGQTLVVTPPTPLTGVTAVRVETVESPSWVSWHEIEIIAPD